VSGRAVIIRMNDVDANKLQSLIDVEQERQNEHARAFDTVFEVSAAETIRRLIRRAYDERNSTMNEHLHEVTDWWANPEDVREVGRMLLCAGILPECGTCGMVRK
jgi:hypothetical protein